MKDQAATLAREGREGMGEALAMRDDEFFASRPLPAGARMDEHADARADQRRLADAAHELRCPLGGIAAMIDLLAATPLSAEQRRYVEGLRAASTHLRAVAGQILGEEPADEHVAAPRPLGPVLAPILVAFEARARHKGVLLATAFDGDVAALATTMRPTALRQVLENLFDNALRLQDRGAISLILSQDDSRLRITLRDEGPGLTHEQGAVLFRRGSSLTGRPGGAGIGLSIVARLCAEAGGTCGAGPRGDGAAGADVWVSVPVEPARERGGAADPRRHRGPHVLVVDDHPASRAVLGTILGHLGCEVTPAEGAAAALEVMATARFDAVFTDLVMPGMDGLAFIRALRATASGAAVPVVVVSGRTGTADQAAARAAGADAIVEKPIAVQTIAEVLQAVGPRTDSGPPASGAPAPGD